MQKNVASQKLAVFAWDSVAAAPKTGDAANITAQISKDGGATAASNDVNPTELDAADAKGVYIFDLTQAETNCDLFILSAVSGTANIDLEPVIIDTTTMTAARGPLLDNLDIGEAVAGVTDTGDIETKVDDVPTVAEFEARTIVSADYVVVTDTIAGVTLVTTTTTNTDMRGTDGANTVVPPTEAQMNARTIPSADYVVVTDTIAGVTLVTTVTTNTDMRGTDGANTAVPDVAGTATVLHTITDALITGQNDLSAAQVNAEVDTALNTAIPGSPTAASINDLVRRTNGLVGQNVVYDDFTFDGDSNQTVGNLYIYDTKAHANAHSLGGGAQTGNLGVISIAGTYSAGLPTIIRKVKES